MTPIFQIRNQQTTWLFFFGVMAILTWITFGSLSGHLLNASGDEKDLLQDVKIIQEDPTYLFSAQRSAAVRPPVDLVFLIAYSLWGENPAGYHLLQIGLHLIASLLLAITMFRLGADLEFGLLSALLFLLNVAHFRSVQWVILINYNLALIFSLSTLVAYHTWLTTGRHHLLALLGLTAATFSHPSAVAAGAFCAYLAWRQSDTPAQWMRRSISLIATTGMAGLLAYTLSSQHLQIQGLVTQIDLVRLLTNPLWYLGRLFSTAHWLTPIGIRNNAHPLELFLGILVILGTIILYKKHLFPVADWAIWTMLMVLPFINNASDRQIVGPSRQLYLASAGSSFIVAWLLRLLVQKVSIHTLTRQMTFALLSLGFVVSSVVALKRSESIDYWLVGRSFVAVEDFNTGIDQFKRAIHQGPHIVPSDIYIRLGAAAFSIGEFPTTLIEQGLSKRPHSPQLNVLLGVSAYLQDSPEAHRRGEARIQKAFGIATDKKPSAWKQPGHFKTWERISLFKSNTRVRHCFSKRRSRDTPIIRAHSSI